MTKVTYMSDLHLEFDANVDPGEGDILVLAGDILVAKYLDPSLNDSMARSKRKGYMRFYEKTLENYKSVYYIHGNHEPYGMDIDYAKELTNTVLPKWYGGMYDSTIEGVCLLQSTLWTDMNKRNPLDMSRVGQGMNDFSLIQQDGKRFTTKDAADIFDEDLATFKDILENNPKQKFLVVTHHAPSLKGGSEKHHGSALNHGYYSDLERFILEHPQIKYWIHGHTHIQKEYMVGDCRVLSNARGYKGYEDVADTFEPRSFTLD